MFNADPHPAELGVLAVQETYSRTVVYANGVAHQPTRNRPDKNATAAFLDRNPSPKRAVIHLNPTRHRAVAQETTRPPIVAVVGANRTSREHLLSSRIADCLAVQGLRVAVTRLAGTRRTVFRESCHWISTRDLGDYGYESTRTCDPRELKRLFEVQMQDLSSYSPDVVVVELCGTLWRQDVRQMLAIIGRSAGPVTAVVSASEPGAASLGIEMVQHARVPVSALWTPRADCGALARDKRISATGIPVCGRGNSASVARSIMTNLKRHWLPLCNGMFGESGKPELTAAA